MRRPEFMAHQTEALKSTEGKPNVAYYLGMGLGKTFIACEQMLCYGNEYNVCVCQKSKVDDWIEHFRTYTDMEVVDYTKSKAELSPGVVVVNYDTIWRRPEFKTLRGFTLILDESSLLQHENTKRTKFILSLRAKNVILASGTPCNGRYENLYPQIQLLGAPITKTEFWDRYIMWELRDVMDRSKGYPIKTGRKYRHVYGYKDIDELKENLRRWGAVFMRTEDVLDLPMKTEQVIKVPNTPVYRKFAKHKIVTIDGIDYVGDTKLMEIIRKRQLASYLNKNKLNTLRDLMESTEDRLIVFYNFQEDFTRISQLCDNLEKSVSYVNGQGRDLSAYEKDSQSVTLVQFQSGSMGLNLQKANKIVMFDPPWKADDFEQANDRIWRMGQERPTFHYFLITDKSIENRMLQTVKAGMDCTLELFREDE